MCIRDSHCFQRIVKIAYECLVISFSIIRLLDLYIVLFNSNGLPSSPDCSENSDIVRLLHKLAMTDCNGKQEHGLQRCQKFRFKKIKNRFRMKHFLNLFV